MAGETAPAAVPDPQAAPASTPTPRGGLVSSLLAPIEPARPTPVAFDLNPATAGPDSTTLPNTAAASSAAYHDDPNTPQDESPRTNSNSSRAEKSVIRAWLLAGAARWAKGGGTRNKRLDLRKARAQAVKEVRQVSVNRTSGGGILPKSSGNSSGAAGKGLGSKGNSGGSGAGKGPKNSTSNGAGSGTGGGGSAQRSGRGPGKDSPGGSGGRSSAGPARTGGGRSDSSGRSGGSGDFGAGGKHNGAQSPKPSNTSGKQDKPRGHTSSGSAGSSGTHKSPSTPGTAGSGTGKTSPSPKNGPGAAKESATCGTASGIDRPQNPKTPQNPKGGNNDKTSKTGKDIPSSGGHQPAPTGKTSPAGTKDGSQDKTTRPAADGEKTNDPASPGNPPAKDTTPPSGKTPAPVQPHKAKDDKAKDGKQDTDSQPDGKTKDGKKPATPAKHDCFSTQASREAGYRDGTRVGKVIAHAQAYRDGVHDGYSDVKETASREKAHLDAAHQQQRKHTHDSSKEQQVTAGSSADYHQPQPIPVTGVTATHVHLGGTAARTSMTRGEVRSLKAYERRLEEKEHLAWQTAEKTKHLHEHAKMQALACEKILEQGRSVKGGDKLIAKLARLHEQAQTQAAKAEEIHKRALRAADACNSALSNARTRYDGIYQAVVDSDETAPAEMAFYRDGN
jgi:hypothetical protein